MNLHERAASFIELAAAATPGPWNIYMNSQDDFVVRKMFADGGEAHVVCRVNSGAGNTFMIAKAPDMAVLIAEMDARIRELTVDAERYRWLRDKSLSAPTGTPIPFQKMRGWVVGPELDAEIDAARKEQIT